MESKTKRSVLASAFVLILISLSPTETLAYIDPGTGSYFLQLLIAGLLGLGFAIKVYWTRLKSFLRGKWWERKENP